MRGRIFRGVGEGWLRSAGGGAGIDFVHLTSLMLLVRTLAVLPSPAPPPQHT